MSDASTTDQRALSPRANIALLSLRLRAAVREAETVEAEAEQFDTEAALAELRSNLLPRFEERKAAMAQELAAAKRESTYALAAAHRESARSIAEARTRADERARAAAAVVAAAEAVVADEAEAIEDTEDIEDIAVIDGETLIDESVPDAPVIEPVLDPETLDVVLDDLPEQPDALVMWPTSDVAPELDEEPPSPIVELPVIVPAEPEGTVYFREFSRPADVPPPPLAPWGPPQTPMNVVIDADAFAKVFAAVLAATLAERGHAPAPVQPMYLPYPAPQQKTSFWSNAKHIDVLLLFLAMVIVVVILIAWLA